MATKYNKLVRDRIPELLNEKKIPYKSRIATKEEYEQYLFAKLLEETGEVIGDKSREEIAVLLEVVEAIKQLKGYTTEEIEQIRLKKKEERGGFEKRIILEES